MTGNKIKSRHRVKPAEPTWQGILPLSLLDQVSVITHSSVLYFYYKPTRQKWLNPSNNNIMSTLKESLTRALVPYYPLAGRVSYIGDGRFQLECNAMGADLVEVESSMKITDFGDIYFASRQKIRDILIPMDYYGTPIHELPVLAGQITRFACGGLSLGMSLSHVVADGASIFQFFKDWTMLAIGEPLRKTPSFDRRRLMLAEPLKDAPFSDRSQLTLADDKPNYFRELRLDKGNWGKLVAPTIVVLTKKMIERLKDAAKEHGSHDQRPYSRFEVIAALVWRCACKARELNTDEMTTLEVPVTAYDRMDPPLTRCTYRDVTNEYIVAKIKFFQEQKTSLRKYQYIDDRGIMEGPASGDHNITIVSWLNLRSVGLNFGWGKEFQIVPAIVQFSDGDFQLSPYGNDGSVVIDACLHPKDKFLSCVYGESRKEPFTNAEIDVVRDKFATFLTNNFL